jgi:hypothetical protein
MALAHGLAHRGSGFFTLLGVLTLGLIMSAVGLSLLVLGATSSQTSRSVERAAAARSLADACIETALARIVSEGFVDGPVTLTLGVDSCSYTVISLGGDEREVRGAAQIGDVWSRKRVVVSALSPQIAIASWVDVADF